MGVVPSTVLLILGLVILGLTKKGHFTWSQYHAFAFLAATIGVFGFVYFLGAMETYELLVKNEAYTASFSFRLKRKIKKILEI